MSSVSYLSSSWSILSKWSSYVSCLSTARFFHGPSQYPKAAPVLPVLTATNCRKEGNICQPRRQPEGHPKIAAVQTIASAMAPLPRFYEERPQDFKNTSKYQWSRTELHPQVAVWYCYRYYLIFWLTNSKQSPSVVACGCASASEAGCAVRSMQAMRLMLDRRGSWRSSKQVTTAPVCASKISPYFLGTEWTDGATR